MIMNFRREIIAGVTTFLTMAYIIFVQPQVLGAAGMDPGAVMIATCLAAAAGSFVMGILANYPIGVAPGMGENFFFTYTVVLGMGVPWEKALGIVFISGVLFIILTIFKVRELVINLIPDSLKYGIAVGIGLFIALIGFHEAGLVVKSPGGLLALGSLTSAPTLLALFGLFITLALLVVGFTGAIIVGMLATAIVGGLAGVLSYHGVVGIPPSIAPTFLKMDVIGALDVKYIVPIVMFLYMVLFDTVGTLIGVATEAGFVKDGKLPRASRALASDAVATTVGAALGTSTTLAYIESIAGVKQGGRTGLTAVVVGLLFVAAVFFYPLVEMIGGGVKTADGSVFHPVTAPALITVGIMMMWGVKKINWEDMSEAIPAFLTMTLIPFTYNIANGIVAGIAGWILIKVVSRLRSMK